MALNLTGALIQGYGLYDQLDRLDAMSKNAVEGTNQLSQQALSGSTFKPFTVIGPQGSRTSATPDGGVTMHHSNMGADMANTAGNAAIGLFQDAQIPRDFREADVYDRIRATQAPDEERARLALESRLYGQGRSGIRSSAYGGSPEMLAMEKAIAESRNNASLSAIQQAEREMAQDVSLGGMLQQYSYLPEAQLMNQYNTGLQTAQLQQAGQLGGQSLAAQLGMGGLNASLEAEGQRAQLIAGLFDSLGGQFGQGDGFWDDPIGGAGEWLFNRGRDLLGF